MKNCAPTTKAVITTKTSDSEVLIFCIEFWELSHLKRELSQAEWEKTLLLQAKQLIKWKLFSLKMTTLTILSEIDVIRCISSACYQPACYNIYFLLQLR